MQEVYPILPTLEHLLEHLLDLEQKLRVVQKRWTACLEVNRHWSSSLKRPSFRNTRALKLEIDALNLLIADCKTAMLEFIPTYFRRIPVSVQEGLFYISKGLVLKSQAPFLIIRQQV